jgi:hypothetical protein
MKYKNFVPNCKLLKKKMKINELILFYNENREMIDRISGTKVLTYVLKIK